MTSVPFDTLRLARSEEMVGAELVTREHLDSRLLLLEQRLTIFGRR